MRKPHLFNLIAGMAVVLALFPAPSRAQTPTSVFIPVALAPVPRDSPLELVALTLDADISESGGRTLVAGNSTFKIHNTDRLNDLQVNVGFPTWASDPYAFDPARLSAFSVSIDGQRVRTLTPARADLKIGSAVRAVDWYTFTLTIAGDEKRTVRVDFEQDLGDGALPRFTYGLVTAQGWKGNIGSARLTLRLPETTTLDQIIASDPADPQFDGASVTWLFLNHAPSVNPSLTILRPSLWSDLNARRRAAQQNPNDANARAALGNLLRTLALMDSPRRDSFYGQAVAELETAVRLDPHQRTARQALAALYESRAGAATGPRQPAYVLLAIAQWEALAANDANARKQLAEDYFYLGLDAQTRLAYADAATYYDKAQALAPNGAGPLFTLERLNAQRKSLNVAWARALIEESNASGARDRARVAFGDAMVRAFTPPPFYVARAQVSMSSNARTMLFTMTPYAAPSAEMQNTLSGIAASLRALGANVTLDGVSLAITVTFADRAELIARMSALAGALPDRAEWAMMRAVLSPRDIVWQEADELITHTTRYREDVDLSSACGAFVGQLDAVTQNLAPLQNASASDEEARLKRALFKYAQDGWQAAFAQGRVVYRVGSSQARVEPCAAQSVTLSTAAFLPERVALIVGAIELVGIAILVARWRRKKR